MFALVTDDTIQAVGRLPRSARRLDTGQWILGLPDAPVDLQQACGWYEVTDADRPDETETTTHDRTFELVDGIPTVVWTERPLTDEELFQRERLQAPDTLTTVAARLSSRPPTRSPPSPPASTPTFRNCGSNPPGRTMRTCPAPSSSTKPETGGVTTSA